MLKKALFKNLEYTRNCKYQFDSDQFEEPWSCNDVAIVNAIVMLPLENMPSKFKLC